VKFIRLLLAEAGLDEWRLIGSVIAAGGAMALMMSIVNSVADLKPDMAVDWGQLLLFALSALVVISMEVYALNLTGVLSERMIGRTRIRLANLVRRSELDGLERIGPVQVYDTIARETTTISTSAEIIILSAISLIALVFSALYIASISLTAFMVVSVLLAAWAYFFHVSQRSARSALVDAKAAETRFFELMGHVLYGLKEIKLHRARGDSLENIHLAIASREAEHKNVLATRQFGRGLAVSFTAFYVLLGSVVFALPQHLGDVRAAMKIVYVVIFMYAAAESTARSLPMLAKVDLAIDRIKELEASLVGAAHDLPDAAADTPTSFKSIVLDGIVYSHRAQDGATSFTVGPCDLTLVPGQMLFIVGSNGSGKSTLMRVLTRLYAPAAGAIMWDGALVADENVGKYRSLFSAVFADFHLFDRLYGMEEVDPEQVRQLLEDVGLNHKVRYQEGRFSTVALSTGQRKRLALVVALIEDRPIYVLDELSADQDPEFRRRYYEEFLPALKARGKTLIAVSHDDRYFHLADRVIAMEDGRFEQEVNSP
jgi:putative pyoverdin transport system ATP-binding/permease protein